jgi:Uma2 family endonuclease
VHDLLYELGRCDALFCHHDSILVFTVGLPAMTATLINLHLLPGQKVTLQPVTWHELEDILLKLGDRRSSRIAYANEILEIIAPLPEHERSKVVIADLVKVLLRVQKRRWESLGSTTFKREGMAAGIEPDDCFYIQNYQAVIGKDRLDLSIDPPPDLAIEADVTSKTELDAYQALGVPELWIYSNSKLTINVLNQGHYYESQLSPTFPNVAIVALLPTYLCRAKEVGVSQALEEFEIAVRQLF